MTDLFDWMTASDPGAAAEQLMRRYRVSEREMRETLDVLAPAFALGLRRAMASQSAFNELLQSLAPVAAPGTSTAMPKGPAAADLMTALFGADGLSHAVSRKASLATGLAPDVIEKLMPGLAAMTLNNVFRWAVASLARGPGQAGFSEETVNPIADMLRRSANAVEAFGRTPDSAASRQPRGSDPLLSPNYLQTLFADALKTDFPWALDQAAKPSERTGRKEKKGAAGPRAGPTPLQPFAPFFDAFFREMRPQEGCNAAADSESPPEDGGDPDSAPSNEPYDMQRMVTAAQNIQDSYTREMLAVFDRFAPKAADQEGKRRPS